MYLLITYNRKNTKVKSYSLDVLDTTIKMYHGRKGMLNLDFFLNREDIDYEYLISEDINLLNQCKILYEKYSMNDFDLKFLSSPAFSHLSDSVDNFIMHELKELTIKFFNSKGYNKTTNYLNILYPYYFDNFIESIEEISPKSFKDLYSHELLKLYFLLPRLLFNQRMNNKSKFYFLTDCFNTSKVDSLFEVNFLSDDERKSLKNLFIEQLSLEITSIFKNFSLD
ncbi:hypothetical protein B879_03784 [Cecembia lonarensis LW9]|uniref:Uncharacterized protein n=1 Tax=Cecembia lonarensis (strain CCUG 58316 / KCTC 22772 / LW9) TaxID=1225176 RepID=K1KTV2_CECL9|nr:hypothetical protein B879_03784 [Cecembia lonarensis LW9]